MVPVDEPPRSAAPAPLVIYGAGGHAREIAAIVRRLAHAGAARGEGAPWELVAFVDDAPARRGTRVDGVPVVSLPDLGDRAPAVAVALGDPRVRERVTERCLDAGLALATLVDPGAIVADPARIAAGAGLIVFPGAVLTTGIDIGLGVHVNACCSVSHDVRLDDFVTLSPGAHVAGNVHLGRRVFVGVGAAFVNGREGARLSVGDDAVIGAGAVVTRALAGGRTYVGAPARPTAPRQSTT